MFEVFIAVLAGLILGSFTGVIVERLGVRGGIVAGRSECPNCRHILAWYDLIPVMSFILMRGRCRYCSDPVSWRYPLMELAMAAALGSYIYMNGWQGTLSVLESGIIAGLVMLFFFDMRHQLLPDELTVSVAALAAVRIGVFGMPAPVSAGIGALLLVLLFGTIHAGSKGRLMGFGDVGLGMVIGLILGWPATLFVLVFSVWIGALVGLMLIFMGRANMRTALPFGSFLTAVAVGALIHQDLFEQLASLLRI